MRIHYPLWSELVATRWFYSSKLIWGSHDKLAQLGQDPDNLELFNTLYYIPVHSSIVVRRRNYIHYFWIKSHPPDQPRENVQTERARHNKLLCFFFLSFLLSFFLNLNEERLQVNLHFLPFKSSSH